MPRIAKIITKTDFKKKVNKEMLLTIPYKDLLPNIHCNLKEDTIHISKPYKIDKLVFSIVDICAPYEIYPIYFAVYIDTKDRLRAFFPKHGNTFNPWTYTAFGDESPYDWSPKSVKLMPKQYYQQDDQIVNAYKASDEYVKEFENNPIKENIDLMIKEIITFIKVDKGDY